MTKRSVYIHIPFCKTKCPYCDFTSFVGCDSQFDNYVAALCNEIKSYANKDVEIQTVYIGGGTPNLLKPDQLRKILKTLQKSFHVPDEIETTIECNPALVNSHLMRSYRNMGINRISIGVQSMCVKTLNTLGRNQTLHDIGRALFTAAIYFDNVSIDLMYGVPLESATDKRDYFNELFDFLDTFDHAIKHVSAYSLTLDEDTPMAELIMDDKLLELDEDTHMEEEDQTQFLLRQFGLKRYEVSNFAKPGYECQHNMVYWNPSSEYYGFGVSACGLINDRRYENTCDLGHYMLRANKIENTLDRTHHDLINEVIMLSLRTSRGIDLNRLRRMGCDLRIKKAKEIYHLEALKLIRVTNRTIRATTEGFLLLNQVIAELMFDSPNIQIVSTE